MKGTNAGFQNRNSTCESSVYYNGEIGFCVKLNTFKVGEM